jgi:hypothetical protein
MGRSPINDLISIKSCQKECLKCIDYKYVVEKRKAHLLMNKNMENEYLIRCMIYTLVGYDYHITNVLFHRDAFKIIHLVIFKHDYKSSYILFKSASLTRHWNN